MSTLAALLAPARVEAAFAALTYDGAALADRKTGPLVKGSVADWAVAVATTAIPDGLDLTITATATRDCTAAGIACDLDFTGWSDAHHLHLPGGVYGGNRARCFKQPYSPRLPADFVGPAPRQTISDIPRLEESGAGRIDLLTGDLASPAVAVVAPDGTAVILLTEQGTAGRDHGLCIEESADHRHLRVRLAAPGVRATRYRFMSTGVDSPDRGGDFRPGDTVVLRLRLWVRPGLGLAGMFDHLWQHRRDLAPASAWTPTFPLSAAADLIARHYERDCWLEQPGLYATESVPTAIYLYQTGWCGGLINTRALVHAQDAQVRERSLATIATMLGRGQSPSGLLWGKYTHAHGFIPDYGHDDARPWTQHWTLARRQGDALWFLLRTFAALEARDPAWTVPASWLAAVRRFADALAGTWERHGQFGHFLDQRTADVAIGGTTSGAIIPGALILAWRRFGDVRYRTIAEAAGASFAPHLERGVTTGGPGDAVHAPDSESVAALVESYAALHAASGDGRWLALQAAAAAQAATWVMPYDYRFPATSVFGRLGMSSLGSVFANAQNKHSAPGLCTHSGLGLLALHRATGDARPLELLADIARSLPQFVSRDDRPIHALDGRPLPSGWINERVNTSDWDDNLGGVFYGMTWAEVSLLLTACELPGVYVRRDLGRVTVFDHVEATWAGGRLTLRNPTPFPARVTVLVEDAAQAAIPFGPAGCGVLPEYALAPGASLTL